MFHYKHQITKEMAEIMIHTITSSEYYLLILLNILKYLNSKTSASSIICTASLVSEILEYNLETTIENLLKFLYLFDH